MFVEVATVMIISRLKSGRLQDRSENLELLGTL